jgi:hypothetical protein
MQLQAPDDLYHHHRRGESQDTARAFFRRGKFAAEFMAVLPARNIGRVHKCV